MEDVGGGEDMPLPGQAAGSGPAVEDRDDVDMAEGASGDSDSDSAAPRGNAGRGGRGGKAIGPESFRTKPRRKATQKPVGSDQKRQAFSKRKRGLVLKAYQLYKLTDAKVFLFVVNDKGSSWAYSSPGFGGCLSYSHLRQMREVAKVPVGIKTFTDVMSHPYNDTDDEQADDRHMYPNTADAAGDGPDGPPASGSGRLQIVDPDLLHPPTTALAAAQLLNRQELQRDLEQQQLQRQEALREREQREREQRDKEQLQQERQREREQRQELQRDRERDRERDRDREREQQQLSLSMLQQLTQGGQQGGQSGRELAMQMQLELASGGRLQSQGSFPGPSAPQAQQPTLSQGRQSSQEHPGPAATAGGHSSSVSNNQRNFANKFGFKLLLDDPKEPPLEDVITPNGTRMAALVGISINSQSAAGDEDMPPAPRGGSHRSRGVNVLHGDAAAAIDHPAHVDAARQGTSRSHRAAGGSGGNIGHQSAGGGRSGQGDHSQSTGTGTGTGTATGSGSAETQSQATATIQTMVMQPPTLSPSQSPSSQGGQQQVVQGPDGQLYQLLHEIPVPGPQAAEVQPVQPPPLSLLPSAPSHQLQQQQQQQQQQGNDLPLALMQLLASQGLGSALAAANEPVHSSMLPLAPALRSLLMSGWLPALQHGQHLHQGHDM